jgi:hypothetical protein
VGTYERYEYEMRNFTFVRTICAFLDGELGDGKERYGPGCLGVANSAQDGKKPRTSVGRGTLFCVCVGGIGVRDPGS